jgi:hypothetical protein
LPRNNINVFLTFYAGADERRLELGQQIQLHFASQNPEEENGAVYVTYQSPIPAWRGEGLSSPESLKSSAAIRLLCQMLREPLFNNLRTKQQLGYVVSSYHDIGFASNPDGKVVAAPVSTLIDYIAVNVLSQKVSPPEVVNRIDEFMTGFRARLEAMPDSELRDHANALSTKLLKPIQNLGSEASAHYGKIRRYSPEILQRGGDEGDIPWNSNVSLAATIKGLERGELLETWDRVVMNKPSRVVSCVYGKKFPLLANMGKLENYPSTKGLVVTTMNDLLTIRKRLKAYDNSSSLPERRKLSRLFSGVSPQHASMGVAAIAVVGAGVIGAMALSRKQKK